MLLFLFHLKSHNLYSLQIHTHNKELKPPSVWIPDLFSLFIFVRLLIYFLYGNNGWYVSVCTYDLFVCHFLFLFCVRSTSDSRLSLEGQGSLRIDGVQEQDGGSYTCRASNLEDSLDTEATLKVQGELTRDLSHCGVKSRYSNIFRHTCAKILSNK